MTKEIITVKDLKVAYGDFVLFDDINFPSTKKTSLSSWAPAAAAKAACCGF